MKDSRSQEVDSPAASLEEASCLGRVDSHSLEADTLGANPEVVPCLAGGNHNLEVDNLGANRQALVQIHWPWVVRTALDHWMTG